MLKIYFNDEWCRDISSKSDDDFREEIKRICKLAIEEGVGRYNHNWFNEEGKDEKKISR